MAHRREKAAKEGSVKKGEEATGKTVRNVNCRRQGETFEANDIQRPLAKLLKKNHPAFFVTSQLLIACPNSLFDCFGRQNKEESQLIWLTLKKNQWQRLFPVRIFS